MIYFVSKFANFIDGDKIMFLVASVETEIDVRRVVSGFAVAMLEYGFTEYILFVAPIVCFGKHHIVSQ